MDDLIKQGATAFKAGDLETSRKLLTDALKLHPDDERAWGWMYNICNTDEERILCLEQMLRINPKNDKAQRLLDELQDLEPPLSRPTSANSKQHSTAEKKTNVYQSPINDKPNKLLVLILAIIAAGLFFSIIGILFVNSLKNTSQNTLIIFPTNTVRSTLIPRATQNIKPKINSAALIKILDIIDMFPSGYAISEKIADINMTSHEEYLKKNLIGYSQVRADAPGLSTVVTQLFLYDTSEAADAAFTIELNRKTTTKEFALKGLYGNERFGRVWVDNTTFYGYTYRDGRLLVMYYFLGDTYLDYGFMEEIVKNVDSKIREYSQ